MKSSREGDETGVRVAVSSCGDSVRLPVAGRELQPGDQSLDCGGGAFFCGGDDEYGHAAARRRGRGVAEVCGLADGRPRRGALRPSVERFRRVAGGDRGLAALETRIDEIRRDIGGAWTARRVDVHL